MQGRRLVERASMFVFIVALAATVMVYLSRGTDGSPAKEVAAPPTRSSDALGVKVGPSPTPVRPRSTPTPTLAQILIAADEVNRFRAWVQAGAVAPTPTPTLAEILVAADQIHRAQEFFRGVEGLETEPSPTLAEVLVAADEVNRFRAWVGAASVPTNTPVPPPPPPPPSTSTPVPPPPPQASIEQLSRIPAGNGWYDTGFEAQVMASLNARRTAQGLGALSLEPRLKRAAKDYAKVLADNDWFNHTGPDGSTLVSRVEAAGFPFTVQIGEVLAWGSNGWPPEEIVQAWTDSPSHREQIMGSTYTRAGIGCYFTNDGTLMVRCVIDLAAG